jgi:hypothetical protein
MRRMLERAIGALALAMAGTVLLAGAAQAKGITGSAYISGPGAGGGSFTIKGGDDPSDSGSFFDFWGDLRMDPVYYVQAPKDVALGPKYDVMLVFRVLPRFGEEGQPAVVHLNVYPYAKGGPWVEVPYRQQDAFGGYVYPGWSFGGPQLFSDLTRAGLPERAALVARPARAPVPQPLHFPWVPVLLISGLTALVLGGALAGRARRAVRSAA